LPLIRKMLADRSEAMLSGIQEELRSSRWSRTDSASPRVRIGLTVFSHEEWPGEDTIDETAEYARPSSKRRFKSRANAKRKRANRER
jgi:hypothetical protein